LVEAIGRPDLWEDARYRTNAGRVEHRSELVAELARVFKTRSRAEWLELLRTAGVPVTPVNDVGEALADPQAEARGLLWEVAHPRLGPTPLLASPLQHMSRTPAAPAAAPPLLGQHTREVLSGALGLTAEELEPLEAEGVIKSAAADENPA
ncbi:MAG TPA: CoA transferase, partial [Oceanithermus profundus]|nr:CoA transferase [Oceanithermus profundus]